MACGLGVFVQSSSNGGSMETGAEEYGSSSWEEENEGKNQDHISM